MFLQDGLTGSAWGDWANYTASPWAPGAYLHSPAGITFPLEEPVFADDACMCTTMMPSNTGWSEMQARCRNALLHSVHGNGLGVWFFLSLLIAFSSTMLTAGATRCDLFFIFNVLCCIFSMMCAMSLANCRQKKHFHVCRKIHGRRYIPLRSWEGRRPKRIQFLTTCLCVASPLVCLCICTDLAIARQSFRLPTAQWSISRKHRNKMQHLRQGNTAQMRTRWESSIEVMVA